MAIAVTVVILDPHTSQPQARIDVEARKLSDGAILDLQTTNVYGAAEFSLSEDCSFHARTLKKPPLYQVIMAAGGMGPFEYDYLVDANWAAEVSAGRGTEGQVFHTFHGHTFKVYSTIKGAVDDANANRQSTRQDSTFSLTSGDHTVSAAITISPPLLGMYSFIGAPGCEVRAGAGSISLFTISNSNAGLSFKGIRFDGAAQSTVVLLDIGNSAQTEIGGCFFDPGGSSNIGIAISALGSRVLIHDNVFEVSTGIGIDAQSGSFRFSIVDNVFWGSLNPAIRLNDCNGYVISGNYIYNLTVGIALQGAAGEAYGQIVDNAFVDCDTGIQFASGTTQQGIVIGGNQFVLLGGSGVGIDFSTMSGSGTAGLITIVNNVFEGEAGAYGIQGDTATCENSIILGNTFKGLDSGKEIASWTGSGCEAMHNISADDVGVKQALADIGSPVGHASTATAAPSDAQYLTLATHADLSDERVFTPGSGLQGADGGAGGAYTVKLGTLTENWVPGAFDIGSYDFTAKVEKLEIDDANFTLDIVSLNPRFLVDTDDYFEYNRASNYFTWIVGSTEYLRLNTTALLVDAINELTGSAGVTVELVRFEDGHINLTDQASPGSTPAANEGRIMLQDVADDVYLNVDLAPNTTADEAIYRFGRLTDVAQLWTEWFKGNNTATAAMKLDHTNGQLQLPVTGSGAGLLVGGEIQFYRGAANALYVDVGVGETFQYTSQAAFIQTGSDTAQFWPGLVFHRSKGSIASPTVVTDTFILGGLVLKGYVGTAFEESATFVARATEDWTGTAQGAGLEWYVTPNTTTVLTLSMLLSNAGQLQLPITDSSAGLLLGGDALLYRSAADQFFTPDALAVDGLLTASGHIQMAASGEIRDSAGTAQITVATSSPHVLVANDLRVDGHVGVGAAPSATIIVKASETVVDSASQFEAFRAIVFIANTAASTIKHLGARFELQYNTATHNLNQEIIGGSFTGLTKAGTGPITGSSSALIGGVFSAYAESGTVGTVTDAIPGRFQLRWGGTGTFTNVTLAQLQLFRTGTAVLTSATVRGIHVFKTTGTVDLTTTAFTDFIGIDFEDLALGTGLNLSLRSPNTSMEMRHAGNIRIGDTAAPTVALDVVGDGALSRTTANVDTVFTITSEDKAYVDLVSDNSNTVGEPGGAFVRFSQDGGAVKGLIGTAQTADKAPDGSTATGVTVNSLVLVAGLGSTDWNIEFVTGTDRRGYFHSDGGFVIGSPTGGSKGVGTINAENVYDDNFLLTDYVFEPGYSYLSLPELRTYVDKEQHLPTMVGRKEWEERGARSLGELVTQLWETVEVQALYVLDLHRQLEAKL